MDQPSAPRPPSRLGRAMLSRGAFAAYGFLACLGLVSLGAFEAPKPEKNEPEASQSKLARDSADPLSGYDSKAYAEPAPHAASTRTWVIPFYIDPAQAPIAKQQAISTILRAAKAWEPCGAKFSYQGYKSKPEYGAYGPDEAQRIEAPVVSFMALPHEQAGLTWTSEADDDESDASASTPAKPPSKGQVVRWAIELDLDSNPDAATLSNTAMHEFGHAIGMEHSRDRKSIMFGDDNADVTAPTARDLAECRRILSTWSDEAAANTGMATRAPDTAVTPQQAQPADGKSKPQARGVDAGGSVPARSSKSSGSSLHFGMSSQAKP